MHLTVLGCYGPFPAAGKACSGYLLESRGKRLLLDCGSGVISNLTRFTGPEELCGVVLSHLHFDHASDLGVLRYALETKGATLPVLSPRTPDPMHEMLLLCGSFSVTDAEEGKDYRFGPFSVRLFPAIHPIEAYSVMVTDGDSTLFYTGDTGIHDRLPEYAENADTILADTCFWGSREGRRNIHLTVPEAASLAQTAGAKRLICSHLFGGIPEERPELPTGLSNFANTVVAEQLITYEI